MENIKSNQEINDGLSEELKEVCDWYLKKMQKCPICGSIDYITYKAMGRPA